MNRPSIYLALFLLLTTLASQGQAFRHPGIYQSATDMVRMRELVRNGPQEYQIAFRRLKEVTDTAFPIRPYAHVMRGPYGRPNIGGEDLRKGAEMAYNCALMWYLTDDRRYARKAAEILDAWSATLWDFDFNDAKLIAGITGHVFCNAAEILRHTPSGWSKQGQEAFRRMLMTAYYPVLRYYYPSANGNWNGMIIQTLMAIGIYTDDRTLFNEALDNFLHAPVNGSLFKYMYPSGQCQETPRDQGHVQLGIGQFAGAAQVAYTQGVDLYSIADHRLALGFEYSASILMGQRPQCYGIISERAMEVRDDFESVYRHYAAMGMELPWTRMCADSIRRKAFRSVLTSVRAWGPPTASRPVPKPSPIAYVAGALSASKADVPKDAVVVEPGQSVQAAVDRVAVTGGCVMLRKGIHTLPASLKLPGGITLCGEGLGTLLFLDPASGMRDAIVNASDTLSGITIRDLVVECSNRTDVPSDPNSNRSHRGGWNRGGIILRASQEFGLRDIRIERVTVRNATYDGVQVAGAHGLRIIDCDIDENGASVVPGPRLQHNLNMKHCLDVEVSGCRLDGSPHGSGIAVEHCRKVAVRGCEIARNARDGILVAESSEVAVGGCLVEGNDRNGITFEFLHAGSSKITVTDNRIHYNAGAGLWTSAVQGLTAKGNRYDGNGGGGAVVIPGARRLMQRD
jgi:hypothetical protein